jgi:hypothetical protein
LMHSRICANGSTTSRVEYPCVILVRRLCLQLFPPASTVPRVCTRNGSGPSRDLAAQRCLGWLSHALFGLRPSVDQHSQPTRARWAVHHQALVRHRTFGLEHQACESHTKTVKVLVLKRFNRSPVPKTHRSHDMSIRLLHAASREPHHAPYRKG